MKRGLIQHKLVIFPSRGFRVCHDSHCVKFKVAPLWRLGDHLFPCLLHFLKVTTFCSLWPLPLSSELAFLSLPSFTFIWTQLGKSLLLLGLMWLSQANSGNQGNLPFQVCICKFQRLGSRYLGEPTCCFPDRHGLLLSSLYYAVDSWN